MARNPTVMLTFVTGTDLSPEARVPAPTPSQMCFSHTHPQICTSHSLSPQDMGPLFVGPRKAQSLLSSRLSLPVSVPRPPTCQAHRASLQVTASASELLLVHLSELRQP